MLKVPLSTQFVHTFAFTNRSRFGFYNLLSVVDFNGYALIITNWSQLPLVKLSVCVIASRLLWLYFWDALSFHHMFMTRFLRCCLRSVAFNFCDVLNLLRCCWWQHSGFMFVFSHFCQCYLTRHFLPFRINKTHKRIKVHSQNHIFYFFFSFYLIQDSCWSN
jgi:hypothetical protein